MLSSYLSALLLCQKLRALIYRICRVHYCAFDSYLFAAPFVLACSSHFVDFRGENCLQCRGFIADRKHSHTLAIAVRVSMLIFHAFFRIDKFAREHHKGGLWRNGFGGGFLVCVFE